MNKSVLITGVTGKFGNIFLEYFLKNNYHVIGTSRHQESIDKLIDRLEIDENSFSGIVVDLTSEISSDVITDYLDSKGLQPNILINNARNLDFLKVNDSGITSRENFLNEFLLDVVIPYELTINLNKRYVTLEKIINIGSQYGVVAPNPALYNDYKTESCIQYGVSKAALGHLTKELAIRLASHNVQVNCIAYAGLEGRVSNEFKERYAKLSPIGRMLKEDEVCVPIEMLISEKSFPLTGQTIFFDGGWSIW